MKNKVLLISIDGMRPDGLKQCNNPFVKELENICLHTYNASSLNPSITLPCHFSIMHSVAPQRHGILTNIYVPQVRPVKGIFEKVHDFGYKSAIFYNWEQMRDVALPGVINFAEYINCEEEECTDNILAEKCEKIIEKYHPEFVFLYMVETDIKGGHRFGWMSQEYKDRIYNAINNVKKMIEKFGTEYHVIITADHGGHEKFHGTTLKEDMTIPMFFYGNSFVPGKLNKDISLLDIAPTIAKILSIPIESDWEGESVI